jgi:D-apiose dehydrogenase
MPRLRVYETGTHFIDTFRFLAGEDCGWMVFEFASGAVGLWDANRYSEPNHPDPRYTFGEFLVEGDGGSIRLAADGTLTVQPLGGPERRHEYDHPRQGFGGDYACATQRHFVERLLDYLTNLSVQEALYESARRREPVDVRT